MIDWLTAVIIGIVLIIIGYIVRGVFSQIVIRKLGWVIMVAGAGVIVIGIILLIVSLV